MDVARIPQRTLLLGGALVATAGSVALLGAALPWLDAPAWAQPALQGPLPSLVAGVLLFTGMALLAVGIGTETGIAGRRVLGIALLVAYGTAWLLPAVIAALPMPVVLGLPIGTAADLLLLLVGLAAALAIVLARRAPGVGRWAMLLVVACQAPAALAPFAGTEDLAELAGRLTVLWPAAIAVAGTLWLAGARLRLPVRQPAARRTAG